MIDKPYNASGDAPCPEGTLRLILSAAMIRRDSDGSAIFASSKLSTSHTYAADLSTNWCWGELGRAADDANAAQGNT